MGAVADQVTATQHMLEEPEKGLDRLRRQLPFLKNFEDAVVTNPADKRGAHLQDPLEQGELRVAPVDSVVRDDPVRADIDSLAL